MEAIEHNEPIFELAVECEKLYAQQISRLNADDEPNGATILSELNQRFAAWAAFLGVFAESNMCLDRRLRHHVEIQDQVLRLLDIMQRNLTYLFEPDDFPEQMEIESSNVRQHLRVSIPSLEAISGAIERLNHLGIAIRQSSVTSQKAKTRKFAETFDFSSFEEVAYLSLKALYAEASEGLLEQLTQSMAETYAQFLLRKSRQEQLKVPRSQTRTQLPIYPIVEQPAADADVGSPINDEMHVPQLSKDLTAKARRSPPQAARMFPHSEPTSVDAQEVKNKFKIMLSPSLKDKTKSILANQIDYPRSAKGSLTCDWCFTPLPPDSLKGVKWRQHVNEDHKPYVCISERCSESLPRFATSTQWFQHMLTTHGQNWHREVHAPSSWACPLCAEEDATLSKPSDLTAHLENFHEGIFTEPQIQAIVRQSRFRFPRPRDICPLCCLSIKVQHDPLSKETGNVSGESSSQEPHYKENSEGSHKRSKTETGHTQSDQNSGGGLETTTEQREPKTTVDLSSSNTVSVEVIASHIAAHLQGLMLLTLRLISIDVVMDVSGDNQSASGATDHQSSWVGSSKRDLHQEMDSVGDISLHGDDQIDLDDIPPSEDIVPDSEYIDWHGVPRYYDAPLEDKLPPKAIQSGTYNPYDGLCEEIYGQIYMKLERRDEEKFRFVTKGTAKNTLHRDSLVRFLQSIILPGHTAMDQFQLTKEDFVRRIDERQLHDFLAVLIFTKCTIGVARAFTTKLVAKDAWPGLYRSRKTSYYLPADRAELMVLFGDKITADNFLTQQACFCPVVIRMGEEVKVHNPEEQRMPYLEDPVLGEGTFGTTFKVRIAKGHFYDHQTGTANLKPMEMARKDHFIRDRFPGQDLREIMKILTSSTLTCRNIVGYYGSLMVGSTYSLFMPLAIYDLRTYMMESISGLNSTMEKADIISSAAGLAGGLNFLHNEMKPYNMANLVCYHMNINRGNILIFRETNNGKTRDIWKLSDFYMGRIVNRHYGKDGEPVLNQRGESTYLGPESLSSTPSMTTKSDVWSLGCIISVVFAYLEGGSEGVTQYEVARLQHRAADGTDCFFVRGTLFTPTKVHPVVKSWHTNLIDQARQRDPHEGDTVEVMLRYLEKKVFEATPAKRDSAGEVEEKLLETFRKYSTLAENPGGTQAKSFWRNLRSGTTRSLR
ncbi:hypothetical protein N7536_000954 [Penicillium majusculum]|nr:hypothetical protein N7536_000954 [Penicillium majusculum]